jgi:hypothetical protein
MYPPEKTTKPIVQPPVSRGPFFAAKAQSREGQQVQLKPGELSQEEKEKNRRMVQAELQFWNDLRVSFPNEGHKIAGSGYDDSIGYLDTRYDKDSTEHRSPMIYIGKEYLSEKDDDKRKALIETELDKIDDYRIKYALINDADKSKGKILFKLKALSIAQKQDLIARMGLQKLIENKELQKWITYMIPSTNQAEGGISNEDGSYVLQFQNIKIIVKPDVFNSEETKPTGADTYIGHEEPEGPAIKKPSFNKVKGKELEIYAPTQVPEFVFEIETRYGKKSGPDVISRYGIGTRPEDTGTNKILRVHEGTHGSIFINFIRENIAKYPYPLFDGNEKDIAKLKENLDIYNSKVADFKKMIADAMEKQIQDVDCVGKTIEVYSREIGEVSKVKCKKK